MIVTAYHQFRFVFATSATPLDPDGQRPWPVDKVRANSFSGGIGPIGKPIPGALLQLTVNSFLDDAVAGTDEYDWYVSQRTDDTTKQFLAISPHPSTAPATKSGSILIGSTALAKSELGFASDLAALTTDQVRRLYYGVHVYCQRKSDDAIQWVDVWRYSQS